VRLPMALVIAILVLAALFLMTCEQRQYAVDVPPEAIELSWARSSEPPLVTNTPPDLITIRWTPPTNSADDVKYVAERHCLAWDMHAEPVQEEQEGEVRVTKFVCKGPLVR
jgi:hypothetical protein